MPLCLRCGSPYENYKTVTSTEIINEKNMRNPRTKLNLLEPMARWEFHPNLPLPLAFNLAGLTNLEASKPANFLSKSGPEERVTSYSIT